MIVNYFNTSTVTKIYSAAFFYINADFCSLLILKSSYFCIFACNWSYLNEQDGDWKMWINFNFTSLRLHCTDRAHKVLFVIILFKLSLRNKRKLCKYFFLYIFSFGFFLLFELKVSRNRRIVILSLTE